MGLGNNIAELRKKAGLTQEKLAERCEVFRQAVTKWESGESEPSIEKLVAISKAFDISVDALISGDIDKRSSEESNKLSYGEIELLINMLNGARSLNCEYGETSKNKLLQVLFERLKTKYIDENGRVKDQYLIANTKKEDREVIVVFIRNFFEDNDNSFEEYVLGNCEIDKIFACVDQELSKRLDKPYEKLDEKRITEITRLSMQYGALISIDDFETYSEDDFDGITGQLYDRVKKLDGHTFGERLMIFLAKEIETAFENRDINLLKELHCDLPMWKDYFWYKA